MNPCIVCRHTDTSGNLLVCDRCRDRLADTLMEIARLYRQLDPVPGRGGASERGAPGFGSSSPAQDDVLVLTDRASKLGDEGPPAVVNVLFGYWDNATDAGATPARRAGATVAEAVRVLTSEPTLYTLACCDWCAEFTDECSTLLGALRRATGNTEPRTPIGTCPQRAADGTECGGLIVARTYGDSARCSRCGRRWEGADQMRRLAATLGDALADAPGVARYLGIEVSTVRVWAHRDGWSMHRAGKRRLYSLAEARDSWARRNRTVTVRLAS